MPKICLFEISVVTMNVCKIYQIITKTLEKVGLQVRYIENT